MSRERREDVFLREVVRGLRLIIGRHYLVAHMPNEGRRSRAGHGIMVGLGLVPGAADVLISGAGYSGWIELKVGDGALSQAQEDFRDDCRRRGIPWDECRSFAEVEDVLVVRGLVERRGRTLRLVPPPGLRGVGGETGAAGRGVTTGGAAVPGVQGKDRGE